MSLPISFDSDKLDAFRSMAGAGGGTLLAELVPIFCDQTPGLLESLLTAAKAGEPEAARLLAHRLKGSASNFGAEPLTSKLQQIEQSAAAGSLPEEAGLRELESVVAATLAALKAETAK